MLYFLSMTEDHELWSDWAATLKEQGLNELVAGLIIAFGPLTILLSQLAYIAVPMVSVAGKDENINAFINLLEDRDQLTAFAHELQSSERNP